MQIVRERGVCIEGGVEMFCLKGQHIFNNLQTETWQFAKHYAGLFWLLSWQKVSSSFILMHHLSTSNTDHFTDHMNTHMLCSLSMYAKMFVCIHLLALILMILDGRILSIFPFPFSAFSVHFTIKRL